ncbi:Uncharacterised protein [uncultured archaeon]|nr:Uncharacterised protein [uncultured archaeon]
MPIELQQVAMVAPHLLGMALISLSFCNIGAITEILIRDGKLKPIFAIGNRIPANPLFISLGGAGFIFLSFTYAYSKLFGVINIRGIATSMALAGSLVALYMLFKFGYITKRGR